MNPETLLHVAQTGPASPAPGGLGLFLPLIAFFLLMYALIIRPQQRQQKEHRTMVGSLQKGDMIVTNGGIHGRVTGTTEEVLTVEIADRVRVKVNKSAVSSRISTSEGEKK